MCLLPGLYDKLISWFQLSIYDCQCDKVAVLSSYSTRKMTKHMSQDVKHFLNVKGINDRF